MVNLYDDNGNLVQHTEIDKPSMDAAYMPVDYSESFTTFNDYDALNRLVFSMNSANEASYYQYDSRDNLIYMADANGPVGPYTPTTGLALTCNLPGNVTKYYYDAASRLLKTERLLTASGMGDGLIPPAVIDDIITTYQTWDLNSRLTTQQDDNLNTTTYNYDELNRSEQTVFADLGTETVIYDADDNVLSRTDQNGSVFASKYDGINRLLETDVTTFGTGVRDKSKYQRFEYDGLSRITKAIDSCDLEIDELVDNDDIVNDYKYNSRSQLLEEWQDIGTNGANVKVVSCDYIGDSTRSTLYYPDGTTNVAYTYESGRDRIDTISYNGSWVANYDYIGRRVLQKDYANTALLKYHNNVIAKSYGYDNARRVIKHENVSTGGAVNIATFDYTYDRDGNRLTEIGSHSGGTSDGLTYDSVYRLIDFTRNGPSIDTWTLDGANNWLTRNALAYVPNEMNEYDIAGGQANTHDENGNLTNDGTYIYKWDAFNRLREVHPSGGGGIYGEYSYDASGRRVERIVTSSGDLNTHLIYFYDSSSIIEERDNSDTAIKRYVMGRVIDEPVLMDIVSGITYYYHSNGLKNIVALTATAAAISERYDYDAYGAITVWDANHTISYADRSQVGNPYTFTGRRYDPESENYYYRARYYNPDNGRFLNHDPIGFKNLGNLYVYCSNNPINRIDPTGLIDWSSAMFTGNMVKLPGWGYGDQYLVQTDKGREFEAIRWLNKNFNCHGFTFGGSTAEKGPFSLMTAKDAGIVLADEWKKIDCEDAVSIPLKIFDIVIFTDVKHSAMVGTIILDPSGKLDPDKSTLWSKQGQRPGVEERTFSSEVATYNNASYECYRHN
ncbi:RHS repeat domain-containing protein [Planctomycetota bacterium]